MSLQQWLLIFAAFLAYALALICYEEDRLQGALSFDYDVLL
ncbi:hypothetical protein OESDEN_09061 [Oesophagostomum dentatum]|uniref:Uncharacterized protein n=1 Tax=Oesophagostomum dentatum TaxID=61180 RepID=A0A0B1T0K1_OESDE|nr:hypothetical protein OESDEN_09061 [Oesophagostomum dentatum]